MTQVSKKKYDLEERTALFAENVIDLCKQVPKTIVTSPVVGQLIRSGTSIGANYCEANGASSGKDFKNKIYFCKKESKETKYWLRMLARVIDDAKIKEECRSLYREAQELTLIFSTIAKNTK